MEASDPADGGCKLSWLVSATLSGAPVSRGRNALLFTSRTSLFRARLGRGAGRLAVERRADRRVPVKPRTIGDVNL
jgi:hypothetical protein